MRINYKIVDYGESETTEFDLKGNWDLHDSWEQKAICEECAKNHWNEHDGWESSWPLVFALHDGENGPELARFSIDMEAEPSFYATPLPPE